MFFFFCEILSFVRTVISFFGTAFAVLHGYSIAKIFENFWESKTLFIKRVLVGSRGDAPCVSLYLIGVFMKDLLISLSGLMAIPGYEGFDSDRLRVLICPHFDDFYSDAVGNHVFVKRSGKSDARKMLIDTHFDEIGMIVNGIYDGGFVSVVGCGGVDRRTLPAGEVVIWGKDREKIYGVVVSTPPHLAVGDASRVPDMASIRIDTGYDKDVLESKISLGAPVTMLDGGGDLLNDCVTGKAFDNRSSVAAAVCALASVDKADMAYDVYVAVSAKEETGMNGAKMAGFKIEPDLALVVDVNLANTPDTPGERTVKCGQGAAISVSAITDRRLTEKIIALAAEKEIKHQTILEAKGTGTNADALTLVGGGIPVTVMGAPLKGMHTPTEALLMGDLESLRDLIAAAVKCADLV